MSDLFPAFVLGIVEGVTEFLPVSSTGHLIISGHLLGFTGPKANTFEVIIQLGAILAVVVMYRERFASLLPVKQGKLHTGEGLTGIRGLWLLFLTCLPAGLLGFFAHDAIKAHLFTPVTVACALAVGAIAILLAERRGEGTRYETLDNMTPALAVGIGLFQCLALWPGFSRSAATIMGGMILGGRRTLAAEYSFIAAVPLMFAATCFDLYKNISLYTAEDIPMLAVGFGMSFISAWAAVKLFINLVRRVTLRPFAWYRLALAPCVLWFWA